MRPIINKINLLVTEGRSGATGEYLCGNPPFQCTNHQHRDDDAAEPGMWFTHRIVQLGGVISKSFCRLVCEDRSNLFRMGHIRHDRPSVLIMSSLAIFDICSLHLAGMW